MIDNDPHPILTHYKSILTYYKCLQYTLLYPGSWALRLHNGETNVKEKITKEMK